MGCGAGAPNWFPFKTKKIQEQRFIFRVFEPLVGVGILNSMGSLKVPHLHIDAYYYIYI